MEFLKPFLVEVTEELLYNIVHGEDGIDYKTLSTRFEEKTDYHPMEFFGFDNVTEQEWPDFITNIPVLVDSGKVYVADINEDPRRANKRASIYHRNNVTNMSGSSPKTVAAYREEFLISSCKIIKDYFPKLNECEDENGNTPLHLIASLPGHYVDEGHSLFDECLPLVKYLLQAGIDPLEPNNDRQNLLHVMFGRYTELYDGPYRMSFIDYDFAYHAIAAIQASCYYFWERNAVISELSNHLTPGQLTLLVNAQDYDGNTVIHVWAEIISRLNAGDDECMIVGDGFLEMLFFLFQPGLRIQNEEGEVALHYAFHPKVFKIFLKNWAVCRTRNDRDETPVLSMLKCLIGFAFVDTSAYKELPYLGYRNRRVGKNRSISVEKAVTMLKQFTDLVVEENEVRDTLWIPDNKSNSAVDIVLTAIRLGSYHLERSNIVLDYTELRKCLVNLLSKILNIKCKTKTKRQNDKGQSALHVLLDMGDENENMLINDEHILQSVELLLKHNADVNAVDLKGRTSLDVANKCYHRKPSLYKKCAALLINRGALVGPAESNTSSATTSRRLRSCPKSHSNNAKRLIDMDSKVTVVGKYRYSNQDLIGSGSFSSIFVAVKDENVDRKSGMINCRAYALKRIEKTKMNADEFRRETNTLLSISGKCENIIKYHESVDDDFFLYLFLELMDGDLNEFVANNDVNKVLKENPAIYVQATKEIINGLEYLHEKRFIHRDLKPGNILYTTDPALHFKIADFGLTKNMSTSSTMTSTRGSGVAMAPGTRCWMAPELISMKSKEHTQQSDIFSLGLVLYYLYTLGKHPFATKSQEPGYIIENRIVQTQVVHAFYPEATSFFQVLLSKDPSKRPPAKFLYQHPFLWSESKKIEFLKAVGDQPEAASPTNYPNSQLEKRLQMTYIGQIVQRSRWDLVHSHMNALFAEITTTRKQKKYRTDKVIDLLRFIRNAYVHKQGKTPVAQWHLNNNIFQQSYPSLVLDVFGVVQDLGFLNNATRSNIAQALTANV